MIKVLRNIFPLDICKMLVGYLVEEVIDVKSLTFSGCRRCQEKGAFTNTPGGADFIVCPCCKVSIVSCSNYVTDNNYGMNLCNTCSMMFDHCCSHGVNGCTDDDYYSSVVTGFYLDGVEFKGMPKFSSRGEIEKLTRSVTIELVIDCWSTLDKRTFCPHAYYKYDKNPRSYHKTGICPQIKMKIKNIVKN